jgi:predicted membrane channel-forming protein YqfA (hemolysin III family)
LNLLSDKSHKNKDKCLSDCDEKTRKLHLIGWVLFVVCALFFIASSIVNKDLLTFVGSLVFLVACIVFLIPLVQSRKNSR